MKNLKKKYLQATKNLDRYHNYEYTTKLKNDIQELEKVIKSRSYLVDSIFRTSRLNDGSLPSQS